jgi:ATP adenylyltransferase/5',5'''-P-1,P-4-tetraphosphate phosphorylase II
MEKFEQAKATEPKTCFLYLKPSNTFNTGVLGDECYLSLKILNFFKEELIL